MSIIVPVVKRQAAEEAGVAPPSEAVRPLVVDLDGTLLKTDLLVESFLHLLARDPYSAIAGLAALRHGKAALKGVLARQAGLNMATMPVNPAVLALMAERRAAGGQVVLASASDESHVRAVADHGAATFGSFDAVMGTRDGHNLSGQHKAAALVAAYGAGKFDYVGNARADLAIWQQAHTAYLAGGSRSLGRTLTAQHANARILAHEGGTARAYLKAMRPHQWLKNLLVFAPAAAGHALAANFGVLLVAFLAFSLCASSVYITSDLLDLAGDRAHPRKRRRPFASGAAPALGGVGLAVALLVAGFGLGAALPGDFVWVMGAYYLLTSAYSFYLKRKPVVDVITLACLYGLRMVAGGHASHTDLSLWMEALAIFVFLSLALLKRSAELVSRAQAGRGDPHAEIAGRGYMLTDLPVIEAMSAAAGYNAVLVLALYINTAPERAAYTHPDRLFFLCVLLLAWISRMLVITRRGWMNDDPIVFAVRDKWSVVIGLACAAVIGAATW